LMLNRDCLGGGSKTLVQAAGDTKGINKDRSEQRADHEGGKSSDTIRLHHKGLLKTDINNTTHYRVASLHPTIYSA
jgi:hypothetical protein